MKKSLLIYILLFFCLKSAAQNLYLKAEGHTPKETKVLDSIGYQKKHQNAKSINEEANRLSAKLYQIGYFENQIDTYIKTNDSTFVFQYRTGNRIQNIKIYTGRLSAKEKLLLNIDKDTLYINPAETEAFMQRSLTLLEQQGYPLSNLQLSDYTKKGSILTASLNLAIEKRRTVGNIIIEGYPKFPEGVRRNILRQYKKKVFNKNNLQRVYNDFSSLRFVTLPRYPEILFKQDTTNIYVYAEKARPNTFDGFIGFSNDEESKLKLNGYLDLNLINTLNRGERFNLYWKNNGDKQTTFNTSLELPYLFKSPVGAKASLKIFKQDSTFQNTVSELNLGYYFNYNSKVYLGYQQTQSTNTQSTSSATLSDYNSKFYTGTYDLTLYNPQDLMFTQRGALYIHAGTGKRNSEAGNSSQYFTELNAFYNFYLSKSNVINLKSQNYYLNSRNYITNELQRFGGINSIRGFNENTLQANMYSLLMAEYRYVAAQNLYVHTITDYGYYQDQTTDTKNRLLGLGFGMGLFTNNGLFNIVYANGSVNSQNIKLSNSIVHISFKTSF
ncbi:hypothetical protein ACLI1A_15305 [Flavobacterium sp. RHBU_3]|uniref:hypothetical protein n=1 Tax=Flavobacterium sp. RHBU_3 TaxID=3391184 RepID=UPI003984B2C6